jgi:hypothetical protein
VLPLSKVSTAIALCKRSRSSWILRLVAQDLPCAGF